jgi:hypothetical protein
MNALYGKMLQKPIIDEVQIVVDHKQATNFFQKYYMKDIISLNWFENDEQKCGAIFKGISDQLEKRIVKPAQYGAFILSYSRSVIYEYMNFFECEDNLLNMPWYGDTDSLHLFMNEERLEKMKPVMKGELGHLANDEKKTKGKIVYAIYLGPKTYYLEYFGNDNKLHVVAKCKGCPRVTLLKDHYEEILAEIELDAEQIKKHNFVIETLKRVGVSTWRDNDPFSIVWTVIERRFMKKLWQGRIFANDQYQSSFPICMCNQEE